MKKIFTLVLVAFVLFVNAQEVNRYVSEATASIPTGYYNTATGTGLTLKTQLKTIITNGHVDQGYGSLWNFFSNTAFRDTYYENDNSLIDIYSENPSGPDPYNFTSNAQQCGTYSIEGDCYNREHLIPQAYFENVAVNPMKNDPFHVAPADGKVNGLRDNYPFGRVNVASTTTANGSKLGSNLNSGYSAGYSATVFEPVNEFKGDIARSFLYFATRYEDQMVSFYNVATVVSKNMFDGTANNAFSSTFLNILLTWHQQDPVSPKEIEKNNAIYIYQGNRNPYIDHPEYACQIWGNACASLSTDTFDQLGSVSIYPNPSTGIVNISTNISLEQIDIITINGQVLQQIKNPIIENNTYLITNLPQGFYFLRLSSNNETITKKVTVN